MTFLIDILLYSRMKRKVYSQFRSRTRRCMFCTSVVDCWLPCHILKVGFWVEDLSKMKVKCLLCINRKKKIITLN